MPRKREYANDAEKHAAFRARKADGAKAQKVLLDALALALDRGRSGKIADNLPEEPGPRAIELAARLDGGALVFFRTPPQK